TVGGVASAPSVAVGFGTVFFDGAAIAGPPTSSNASSTARIPRSYEARRDDANNATNPLIPPSRHVREADVATIASAPRQGHLVPRLRAHAEGAQGSRVERVARRRRSAV